MKTQLKGRRHEDFSETSLMADDAEQHQATGVPKNAYSTWR
jgi:hypothetical protein